ncbi:MAG: ABC transporter permease, partial [Acetobacteraceae bacterium]
MTRILAARLAQIAVTLAILSFCAFALIALMPGDPIEVAIAGDPRLTAEDAARLRALHGLDRPFQDRYLAWAGGLLRGEFGYSRLFAQPVAALLGPALLSTLALAGTALLIALTLGVALGALAAARPRAAPAVDAVAVMGQAMPTFWLGILLIIAFAVTLGWLPAGGVAEHGPGLRYLVLPVATLAIAHLAAYARHSAASLEATLTETWIRTARARGASERV